ncbi:MAG: helix-turn-helix domain-containing protein [Cyclobacteriaceae bacterium]|nr:helix-turn-helix domain-containing protein [Cyclobacteriaceae bacterium]
MSKLIEFRERLNLTQEELSSRSGVSVRTIQRVEAGIEPKGHTLKALAKALEVNESKLLIREKVTTEYNYTFIKLINLSSLFVTYIPPLNIVVPLIIMFALKQFNPLTKQIISVQILWTILSFIIFMLSAFAKNWFSIGNKLTLIVMVLLVLSNVYIILRNTAEIDKNKKLHINLNFSII